MDKIILNNLKFFAHLGCSSAEKSVAQLIIIDVELSLNLLPAGISDNLSDSVNYVEVKSRIQQLIENTSKNLIESLAHDISSDLLEHFPLIHSVSIKIFKPLSDASIQIERSR